MPIRENFNETKLYVTINASLIIGTVTSNAFNFDNGFGLDAGGGSQGKSETVTGADNGISFAFGTSLASGLIIFIVLQSATETGQYTNVPGANIVSQLDIPLSSTLSDTTTGVNLLRLGLIGNTGPYYKVSITSTIATGIGWGIVEISSSQTPIQLAPHTI